MKQYIGRFPMNVDVDAEDLQFLDDLLAWVSSPAISRAFLFVAALVCEIGVIVVDAAASAQD
jgi:hypothetical protein